MKLFTPITIDFVKTKAHIIGFMIEGKITSEQRQ